MQKWKKSHFIEATEKKYYGWDQKVLSNFSYNQLKD